MVEQITFRFTPGPLGSFDQPQPPIPDQAGVILLQRGKTLVGVWDAECSGFMHPANQGELADEALTAVLESYPDAASVSGEIRVFTCPSQLLARFDWQWPNAGTVSGEV
jgi:hypothetical protein